MRLNEIVKRLKAMRNPKNVAGMARFGINTDNAYGISIPELRAMAKRIGKDHALAQGLWNTGIHDARLLACLVDDPKQVTAKQMESWVKEFDSWDICDQCCMNFFDKTRFAHRKAAQWSSRRAEFVKRAGFALMASLASHDREADDEAFVAFFPLIVKQSVDERNFVRKAVNWALRQIGKRNRRLNRLAIATAKEIRKIDSKSARWIASDALRELTSEKVKSRLVS